MTATHPAERERCLEVKSSMGGRMIRLKATYRPFPTFLIFPLLPRTNTGRICFPFALSDQHAWFQRRKQSAGPLTR